MPPATPSPWATQPARAALLSRASTSLVLATSALRCCSSSAGRRLRSPQRRSSSAVCCSTLAVPPKERQALRCAQERPSAGREAREELEVELLGVGDAGPGRPDGLGRS